ncbi:MAG TPA: DUF1990 family protein [Euzebyales bacterium]|nr:DUF1990 family protein [Euzebyales bacterium]
MIDLRTTAPLSNPRAAAAALLQLRDAPLNFDLERRAEFTTATGWKLDHHRQALPPEPPGPPLARGSWATCRRLTADYAFADPAIVRAMYDADQPLERRDMLLEGRFYGLRFLLGLRVGGVEDDTITIDGRPVRRWSWNYRTLRGHLEMGQMDYTVAKWTDTGEVEFRIDAFSRAAHIPNAMVRLGFALFGRHMQRRYARTALRRMRRLVDDELAALSSPGR